MEELASPGIAELEKRIRQLSARLPRVLVAIDGRCAAGKTTLAGRLAERWGWSTVHMDHFFPRPEQRTRERWETPGENVDHERFLEEVLRPLAEGRGAEYRPFDCHTQSLSAPVRVEPGSVVLVEGSYACHPELWNFYHLRVFLTVGKEEQLRRIEVRNGPERAQMFQSRWIPLEERYFEAFRLRERCDLVLEL